jgi:Zn-dependent protease
MNDTPLQIVALVPALVCAIVFHEVAHGWVANMLGDPTAKERKRLSLNPLRHVDIFGTLILPGLLALSGAPVFGWAKPVPVNKWRLRNPRFGMMAVAAAGPGTNLLLAALAAILIGVFGRLGDVLALLGVTSAEPSLLGASLGFFLLINVFLATFNLLPIPPFDGSHIVEGLLPQRAARAYERMRPYGFVFFFALIAVTWLVPQWHVLQNTVGIPAFWALEKYLHLAAWLTRS